MKTAQLCIIQGQSMDLEAIQFFSSCQKITQAMYVEAELLQSENEEGENASSKSVLYTSRKIYGFVNQSTDFYLPDT